MENNLMIKEVDFNGANLLAAQDENGKIYVGVKLVCDNLGLDVRRQKEKILTHDVFSKGVSTLPLPSNGGVQDTIVIELDFLPLWLANINPKLVNPLIKDKLIDYQLKAKDVLAKAFLPNQDVILRDYLQLDEEERAIAYFQERKERKLLEQQTQELIPKAQAFEQLISAKNNQPMLEVAKAFKTGRNRMFQFLRLKGILMKNNVPYQNYIEQKLFVVREYTIPDADGELINRTQTLVTAKGIEFIDRLMKQIDYKIDLFLEEHGNDLIYDGVDDEGKIVLN